MDKVAPILHAPAGWGWENLGDVCRSGGGDIQTGPFGSQLHASDYVSDGVPAVMPKDIGDNRIVPDSAARIDAKDARRLSRYLLQRGDIIYGRRGDIGRHALVRPAEVGWLCGTGCLRIRLGRSGFDAAFVSWYLAHPAVVEWIRQRAVGATMPNLNTAILESVPIPHPPLPEQERIANILTALDDKIELNRRTIQTSQRFLDATFRRLMADPGAASPIPIDQLARVAGGSTPPTEREEYWLGGSYAWATPKDLSRLQAPVLLETERRITDKGVARIGPGMFPAGTVLLSSRAPIGYLAISEIPTAVNQGIIAMVPIGRVSSQFLFHWAQFAMDDIKARANGTTFQEISKGSFRPMVVRVPPRDRLEKFDSLAAHVHRLTVIGAGENRTLAELRDLLLPKLISGAIGIKDVEKTVESAV